jgi:hypothetical protein
LWKAIITQFHQIHISILRRAKQPASPNHSGNIRKEHCALCDLGVFARIWIDGDKFTMEQQYHDRHGQRL